MESVYTVSFKCPTDIDLVAILTLFHCNKGIVNPYVITGPSTGWFSCSLTNGNLVWYSMTPLASGAFVLTAAFRAVDCNFLLLSMFLEIWGLKVYSVVSS